MGLHQTKKLLHRKGNHQWNKQDNTQNGIKYLQRYISNKRSILKIYKNSYNSEKKKKSSNPSEKWAEDLNRHFSKEDTDGQQEHEKKLLKIIGEIMLLIY